MRVALDTNILDYAEGVGDVERHARALSLIGRLDPTSTVLPAQTLGELFRVLTGKAKRPLPDARDAILSWSDSFPLADSTWSSFQMAFEISVCAGSVPLIWGLPRAVCRLDTFSNVFWRMLWRMEVCVLGVSRSLNRGVVIGVGQMM
jgi:hypothetical protein